MTGNEVIMDDGEVTEVQQPTTTTTIETTTTTATTTANITRNISEQHQHYQ
jgi:hypothetical protein